MSDQDYESTLASKVWNIMGGLGLFLQRNNPDSTHAQVSETFLDPAAAYWKGNAAFGLFL